MEIRRQKFNNTREQCIINVAKVVFEGMLEFEDMRCCIFFQIIIKVDGVCENTR